MRASTRVWIGLLGLLGWLLAASCEGDGGGGGVIDADGGMDVRAEVAASVDVVSAPDLLWPDVTSADVGGGAEDVPGTPETVEPHQIRIGGLSAPVEVHVDESGVMHLGCATDSDCLMAMGYVHAHRRFFIMDVNRRSVTGRLATLYGMLGVPNDEQSLGYHRTMEGENVFQAMWDKLSPETQEMFVAYAAGVNRWLDDMRAGLVAEQEQYWYRNPWASYFQEDVLETIPDWDVLDSVAIWYVQMQGNGDLVMEPTFEAYAAYMPEDLAADMFAPSDSFPTFVLDTEIDAPSASKAPRAPAFGKSLVSPELHARIAAHDEGLRRTYGELLGRGRGSNNWAVSSALTGGPAIHASDPHGPLGNPPYGDAYVIDAVTNGEGTLHVGGTAAVGTPLFIIAFNRDVVWGCTTSYVDSTDIYVETLSEDGTGVVFNGEVVPFVEKTFTIEVAGGEDQQVTHRWVPHHGPVVVYAPERSRVITRRWTGHGATTDIEAYAGVMRATSVAEAMESLELAGGLGCNVVMADSSGDVGWQVASWVPNRPWASPELAPWRYLPGDGSAEWDGYVPFDRHPRVYQPRDGFVATANNAFDYTWFDGDPTNDERPYSQVYYSPGYRYSRIAEALRAIDEGHSVADSVALQAEDKSLQAPVVVAAIRDFVQAHPDLLDEDGQTVAAALADWQMSCPTGLAGNRPDSPPSADEATLREARGCLMYHAAQIALGRELFGDEMRMYFDSEGVGGLDDALHHYLKNPDDLQTEGAAWDDLLSFGVVETQEDIFRVALNTTLDIVRAYAGDDPAGWLWGRVHTLTLRSNMGKAQWDVGPFANDGAHMGVDPGYTKFDESGFEHVWGPILRFVVAMHPEGPEAWYQLPGGLDMHSDSPYYANLIERWLDNEPVPIAFSHADAVSAAQEMFTILPE